MRKHRTSVEEIPEHLRQDLERVADAAIQGAVQNQRGSDRCAPHQLSTLHVARRAGLGRPDTDRATRILACGRGCNGGVAAIDRISEVGLCEHHLLPIIMSITIAYIPDQKILGLSKLSRIAGYFARRWQNQERTAHLIAEFIEKVVEPEGVAVFIEGKHMCAMARGVRDTHSVMKVNVLHGSFQTDESRRSELFMRIGRHTA